MRYPLYSVAIVSLLAMGCMSKLEEQTKAQDSIIGKTTQKIEKFDPAAKLKQSDSKVVVTPDPVSAAQAYRPIIEQTAKLQIEHAIKLFNAANDRYPKDYAEFMSAIIEENNIRLPVLPQGWTYQYDEKKHELVVVQKPAP